MPVRIELRNVDPSALELLDFEPRTLFTKKNRILVARPVVVFRLVKSIASSRLAANVACGIVLHLPKRTMYLCPENEFVHPKENA